MLSLVRIQFLLKNGEDKHMFLLYYTITYPGKPELCNSQFTKILFYIIALPWKFQYLTAQLNYYSAIIVFSIFLDCSVVYSGVVYSTWHQLYFSFVNKTSPTIRWLEIKMVLLINMSAEKRGSQLLLE